MPVDLSDRKALIRDYVRERPGLQVGVIARHLELPKRRVRWQLARLEAEGMLYKYPTRGANVRWYPR